MMYSIDVLAAFDFLDKEVKVGTLEYERLKGSSSYRFACDEKFLESFPSIKLSADLGDFAGWQSARSDIFSFLGDALPDRWGRALVDKRERIIAQRENRIPRVFDDFGYLIRIDDSTRSGALRFRYKGQYIGLQDDGPAVPPIASLDEFIRDAHQIERADDDGIDLVRDEWLLNVWRQGSSLGGARPKASIEDNGSLWIAKIPSAKDSYDIAIWEHFACVLAKKAGIDVAETRIISAGPTPYHTLLSKRFDREGTSRVHFASSLTLTGLRDGDNAENNKGYIDIVDAMAGDCGVADLRRNVTELFRRVVFNIIIGNHDDHFRNHGFLLRKEGWQLSPAYDINPTNSLTQSLMISEKSNDSSLAELLEASDYYLIERHTAEEIMQQVLSVVEDWRTIARRSGISSSEQQRFGKRIEYSLEEGRKLFPPLSF